MAIIGITYWYSGNNRQRFLGFDNVSNTIKGHPTQGPNPGSNFPAQDDIIDILQPTKTDGVVIYSNATKEVVVQGSYPFALVRNKPAACTLEITDVSIVPDNGTGNGSFYAQALGATQFRLLRLDPAIPVVDTGYVPADPGDNKTFSGLTAGRYVVYAQDGSGCNDTAIRIISLQAPLAANAVPTNVSANGLTDGEIQVNVTSGKGQYRVTYLFDMFSVNLTSGQNPQSTIRTGLAPGVYDIVVEDLIDLTTVNLQVEITEPAIPLPDSNYFFVPKMNSLEFVHEQTPDFCEVFQTLDNVRYCKQQFPDMYLKPYVQKVARCDVMTIQFRTNYLDHVAELLKYEDDTNVAYFTPEEVEKNVGFETSLPIIIRNNGGGKSRVYFNTGSIPLELKLDVGSVFFIVNNLDGFNGSYTVESVENDSLLNAEYLVINKNYAIAASSSAATGTFYSNVQEYNVQQFAMDLNSIPDGVYYVKITASTGPDLQGIPALSEPFLLKNEHPNTNLLKYRNFDNAFDMTYTTGIVNILRVDSRFFNRLPAGERENLRNGDGRLIKIYARKTRRVLLEVFEVPPWMHEKLSTVFDHDFFSVNEVEFQSDEGYKEPSYRTRYGLSNSSIALEQVRWYDTYNTDDIPTGTIEETGFVIANDGLLKQ